MNIGSRLKKLRLDKNMTLDEVGTKIGTTKQTLYKYENGIVTNIPSDKIEALAKIYGTTPAYIMGWEPKDNSVFGAAEKRFLKAFIRLKESRDEKDRAVAAAIERLLRLDEQESDDKQGSVDKPL